MSAAHINIHAPGPEDDALMASAGIWYCRTDFKQSYPDDTVQAMCQRYAARNWLNLCMEITTDEATADALSWNAVRCYHIARDMGVVPRSIELLNEPNLSNMGPWARIPERAGEEVQYTYHALRAAGYKGEIYSGSISSLEARGNSLIERLIEQFTKNYKGLDYLARMKPETWPADMGVTIHAYAPRPAPGWNSTDEEWARVKAICGNRRIMVTEVGSTTKYGMNEEQAAAELQSYLEYWNGRGVDVFVYTWAQKSYEEELKEPQGFYGITLPGGKTNLRYDVVKNWNVRQLDAA